MYWRELMRPQFTKYVQFRNDVNRFCLRFLEYLGGHCTDGGKSIWNLLSISDKWDVDKIDNWWLTITIVSDFIGILSRIYKHLPVILVDVAHGVE